MNLREAIASITTPEEKAHLESLKIEAARKYISLVSNGQRPHGTGKSQKAIRQRKAKNKMARQSRRVNSRGR